MRLRVLPCCFIIERVIYIGFCGDERAGSGLRQTLKCSEDYQRYTKKSMVQISSTKLTMVFILLFRLVLNIDSYKWI
jgi:hypothetical protein